MMESLEPHKSSNPSYMMRPNTICTYTSSHARKKQKKLSTSERNSITGCVKFEGLDVDRNPFIYICIDLCVCVFLLQIRGVDYWSLEYISSQIYISADRNSNQEVVVVGFVCREASITLTACREKITRRSNTHCCRRSMRMSMRNSKKTHAII